MKFQGSPEVVRIKASGKANSALAAEMPEFQNDINKIFDAVHQAYIQATTNPF